MPKKVVVTDVKPNVDVMSDTKSKVLVNSNASEQKVIKPKLTVERSKSSFLKVPSKNCYGTGKRKTSIAKVWVFEGTGIIEVNGIPVADYIKNELMVDYIWWPLNKLNISNKYNVVVKALGGGLIGQAGAIRLGIARALLEMNQDFKALLREDGLLTRDSRIKERKKYGRKKARKGFQFRKR